MSTTIALKPEDNVKLIHLELAKPMIQDQITKALSNLSRWVTPDKMVRVALTAIRGDEKLAKSTPVSIVGAVIQLAQVGLVSDGFLGQAYLIPYYNKDIKRYEASPLIGYRGYGELAVRSGKATSVDAHVVYAGDQFDYQYGDQPYLRHKMEFDPKKRGAIIAAYAIVYMKEGPHRFEIMSIDQIEKVKTASEGAGSDYSPWKKWYDEMVRKTPMRRLAKWVPLSPEFQMAAGIDEASELGLQRTVLDNETGQVFFVPKGEATESIERPTRESDKPAQAATTDQPAAENVDAAKCVCTCCKMKDCQCPDKPENNRCGCGPCKRYVAGLAATQTQPATETAAPAAAENQPTGSEMFPKPGSTKPGGPYVSQDRLKKLFAVAKSAGVKVVKDSHDDELHKMLKDKFNIESVKEIPETLFDQVLKAAGGDKLNIK